MYVKYYPELDRIKLINEKKFGKAFYEDGKLKAEWKNKNYEKEGFYKEYHHNGSLKVEVNYVNGERDGMIYKYYDDSVLKEEWSYSKGVKSYIKKYNPDGS